MFICCIVPGILLCCPITVLIGNTGASACSHMIGISSPCCARCFNIQQSSWIRINGLLPLLIQWAKAELVGLRSKICWLYFLALLFYPTRDIFSQKKKQISSSQSTFVEEFLLPFLFSSLFSPRLAGAGGEMVEAAPEMHVDEVVKTHCHSTLRWVTFLLCSSRIKFIKIVELTAYRILL